MNIQCLVRSHNYTSFITIFPVLSDTYTIPVHKSCVFSFCGFVKTLITKVKTLFGTFECTSVYQSYNVVKTCVVQSSIVIDGNLTVC